MTGKRRRREGTLGSSGARSEGRLVCPLRGCSRSWSSSESWAHSRHVLWHTELVGRLREAKREETGTSWEPTDEPLPRPLHRQLRGPVGEERLPSRSGNEGADTTLQGVPEQPDTIEQRDPERQCPDDGGGMQGGEEEFDMEDGLDVRNATGIDLFEAAIELIQIMSGDSGSGKASRLLTVMLHENWSQAANIFREAGIRSAKDIRKVSDEAMQDEVLKNGFCKRNVRNPTLPDSNLDLYVRSPLKVIEKQLEKASESQGTFYFEPFIERNRFAERVRGHPLSADLAWKGYEAVKYDVMGSPEENTRWVEGESFVAFLQLYTDASCMSLRTSAFSFYPLHVSLLNAADSDREAAIRKGETVSAYLPTVKMWPTAEQRRIDHARKFTVDGEPLTSYEPDPLSPGMGSKDSAAVSNYRGAAPKESREILGESLTLCLAELREVAKKGFTFQDRDGKRRQAHFVIASYVADTPEVICVTCLVGGYCPRCKVAKSDLWKPGYVGELRMAHNTEKAMLEYKDLVERAQALPNRKDKRSALVQAERILRDEGLTSRLPFNYDWPFSRTDPIFDPYRLMRVDVMHTFPLGIQKEILTLASKRLKSENLHTTALTNAAGKGKTFKAARKAILSAANSYLRLIEEEAPAVGLHVDFARGKSASATDGLFAENGVASMLEAKDMKNVAQVMPFVGALIDIMCGSDRNGASVTAVFVRYVELERHIMRRGMDDNGHSDRDLSRLQEMLALFKNVTYTVFKDYQASEFNFPKWHALEHIVSDIFDLGRCTNFSADAFEQSHTVFKSLNREGSQRKSTGLAETVSRYARGEARRNRLSQDYARQGPGSGDMNTPMIRYLVNGERPEHLTQGLGYEATFSDACVLATTRSKKLATNFMEIATVLESISEKVDGGDMRQHDGVLGKNGGGRKESRSSDLPASNQFVAAVGGYALAKKVLDILRAKYADIGTTGVLGLNMHIVKSARVAGFHTPSLDDVVETTRGSPELFVADTGFRLAQKIVSSLHYTGRATPLQDNVLVEGDEDILRKDNAPPRRHMWVAKVLLFLSLTRRGVGASLSFEPLGTTGGAEEVAVVRYYQVIPKSDTARVDNELRCVKLKWSRDDNKEPWVDVIPASAVRGRLHVVPAPKMSTLAIGSVEGGHADVSMGYDSDSEDEPSRSQIDKDSRVGAAVFAGSHGWLQREFYVNRFRANPADKPYHIVDR